jgi:hypothetical protein
VPPAFQKKKHQAKELTLHPDQVYCRSMNTRLFYSLLAGITLLVSPVKAQVLIYDLALDETGRSVNYTFFDSGYLVVDLSASTFSSVIVLTDPNTFRYYQTADLLAGSYETMLDYSGHNHAVMFGASSGTDNAALQVIGNIESNSNIGGEQRSILAKKLQGYFLASGAQVDAITGNSTTSNSTGTAFEYGYAGSSKATATYNIKLTKQANNQGYGSAAALNLVGQILANRGVPGYTPTPTPSPTPTPTPTR